MKKNIKNLGLLTLPMVLVLSSCTMASIEINKPPVQPSSNSETSEIDKPTSSSENKPSSSEDKPNLSSSESTPESSESSSTSQKDPVEFDGLSFEEGKAVATDIINYIDTSTNYNSPNAFKKNVETISYQNIIEKKTTIDDTWVNFDKLQYKSSHVDKSMNIQKAKPTINWIYQEPDTFNLIKAQFLDGVNSYSRLSSSETMINNDFIYQINGEPLIPIYLLNENIIKTETKTALTFVSSNAKMYELAKRVSIKSENEGHLLIDVSTDITIKGLGTLKELYLEVKDYNVIKYHIESVNNNLTSSITRVYNYTPFDFDYPDLSKFKEDVTPEPNPDSNTSSETSSSSENVNN